MNDYPNQGLLTDDSEFTKYERSLNFLYYRIYNAFVDELGLICSYSDFNSVINLDDFLSEMIEVCQEHGHDSKEAHEKVLGLVAPGIHATRSPTLNFTPAAAAASMFNISKMLFPSATMTADAYAKMFNIDLESSIENLADAIGQGMKNINVPPGANIFNRGGRDGGGFVNDDGELIIDPPRRTGDYFHHEPVKNELNWTLLLENTMQGTEPFWDSGQTQTCFVAKFNMIQFPNDDVALKQYYEGVLIPVLRNSVQANKRFTADVGTYFTYANFKQYINEIIQSISIYYFFANGFAYCNQPGLVNNNEALRYLRQELFNTTQLQRFQQLGQLIESLPVPQTLINAIAQYHGWYSNSPESNATLYCNIPHGVFDNNLYSSELVNGRTGALNRLNSDIILGEIAKLTGPIVNTSSPVDDQKSTDKFLGLLLNTIPGWRNSSVGGSSFSTDVYDEAHWNEFMNSPTVQSVKMLTDAPSLASAVHELYPRYLDDDTPHRYYSLGDKVPGYLQAYWTPLAWSDPPSYVGVNSHGIIKPQPRTVKERFLKDTIYHELESYSNVMIWVNAPLFDDIGGILSKGFTLFPTLSTSAYGSNISSPIQWWFDDGNRFPPLVPVIPSAFTKDQQPPCTYRATNMSINQCTPNRLLAVQKLLDVQDFFEITSPSANRASNKSSGRRGRRGKSSSKAVDEVKEEGMEVK